MQDVQTAPLGSFQDLTDQQLLNAVWEKVRDVPILTPEFLSDNLKENEYDLLAQKLNLNTSDPSIICNEFNRIKSSQYMIPSQFISSYSTVQPPSSPTNSRYFNIQPQNPYTINYPQHNPVQQHFPPKKTNKVAFLSMYPVHQIGQGQISQSQAISQSNSKISTPSIPPPKPVIKHRVATAVIPPGMEDKIVPKPSIVLNPQPQPQTPPKKMTRMQVARLTIDPKPVTTSTNHEPQRDVFGEELAEHVSLIVERLQRISDNICTLQKSVVRVNAKLETIECA